MDLVDIKELINNTFGAVVALTIILFVIVFIAYGCSGVDDQLKETLDITVGFFGGFATLGAAFIATNLFNDWRAIEDHKTKNEHINNAVRSFLEMQNFLKAQSIQAISVQLICAQPTISFTEKIQLITMLNEFHHNLLFSLRALKIHIQLFANVSDSLILCGNFEQIIDNLESPAQTKFNVLISSINTNTPQQTMHDFHDYFVYTSGTLVVDLHSKVIMELTKNSKALT